MQHFDIQNIHRKLTNMLPSRLICLDAEFARGYRSGEYMLELSIYNGHGRLIYEQRFKPARISSWTPIPHGIKPSMVAYKPSFKSCLKDIQKIIDAADYITGFALENDLPKLRREGVIIPEHKKIAELRDWFWEIYGRDHGLDYVEKINNETVAENLGFKIDSAHIHSSAYDTYISFQSFNSLVARCDTLFPQASDFPSLYDLVNKEFRKNKFEYDKACNAGYCIIEQVDDLYRFKVNKERPETSDNIIAIKEVANRKEALVYFSQLILGKVSSRSFRFKYLSDRILKTFDNYTDKFTREGLDYARKLIKLSRIADKTTSL